MALESLSKLKKDYEAKRISRQDFEVRACLSAIGHSIVHKNATPANDVLASTRKFQKRELVKKLLEDFGNLVWMSSEKRFGYYSLGKARFDEEAVRVIRSKLVSALYKTTRERDGVRRPRKFDESTKGTSMRASKYGSKKR
jgi:hypothetical protein